MGKLDGKVALITGAASGIGRASALLFAREGARLLLADTHDARLAQVCDEIASAGGQALGVTADVSRAADVERMVQAAVEGFGRLDVLYNNAGVVGLHRVHEMPEEEWDRVIDVCLKGVFLGCKYALPELMRRGGVILNTASIAGMEGLPGHAHYCAAKAGVINLTRSIAMDYAQYGVRANAVCPGAIVTNIAESMTPQAPRPSAKASAAPALAEGHPVALLNRRGDPAEVAAAALYLCSDDASYVTGQTLVVDGGWMAGHKRSMQDLR